MQKRKQRKRIVLNGQNRTPVLTTHKICVACRRSKPLGLFTPRNNIGSGGRLDARGRGFAGERLANCKVCRSNAVSEKYATNPKYREYINKKSAEQHAAKMAAKQVDAAATPGRT